MKPEVDLLSRYRQEAIALRDFEEHMDLMSRPTGPRGLSSPRASGEHTNDPESASRQLEEGLEAMLESKRARIRAMEPEVMAVLSRVTKPTMLKVLVAYYMQGLSNEATAEQVHLVPRQARRLRREFLDSLP